MRNITICCIAFINFISIFECNAQLNIENKIVSKKICFDQKEGQLFFDRLPFLSLSASDFVIEEYGDGIKKQYNWNNYKHNKFSAQLTISEYTSNIIHLECELQIDSLVKLSDLFFQFKFLPRDTASWSKCSKEFHWIPNIKSRSSQIASDHVFRSPAVIMMSDTFGVALVPDINLINENRPAPYYLDMRFSEKEAPKIIYGIAPSKVEPHTYYSKSGEPFVIKNGKIKIGFYIIVDQKGSRNELLRETNNLLWEKFGRNYITHHEPQTVPFKQYAEYGYDMAMKELWVDAHYPNSGGITLSTYFDKDSQRWGGRDYPNDLWFHSWFNNMRTAFGLYQWGERLSKPEWKQKALEVKNLILNAPVKNGFFKTIYNSQENSWVASGQGGGENVYHLPDNSWTAYWLLRFTLECEQDKKIDTLILNYANALLSCQKQDGSFPARIFIGNLKPDSILNGSASEGLSIWFLAEMRLRGRIPDKSKKLVDDAIKAGLDHIQREILPRQKFEDFELYFSCSSKPLNFYDPVSEMYGQNTLSIQWCAEAFRTGYQLFKRKKDYNNALYCIDLLCLYQQVWNPSYLSFYAFGGFGVMNTDAEWNDARQAQFAETLANFYDLTGNKEYMERAIAAAKASFTLMVIDENKKVAPFNYKGTEQQFEIHGAMAENYGHCGSDCRSGQSGFHWGTGSALCTSINLINRYGDLYIDPKLKHVFGINGIIINASEFISNKIVLSIDRLTNDKYFGKLSETKKAGNFQLNVNSSSLPIDSLGIFRINPDY
jgi:hypothetical protein